MGRVLVTGASGFVGKGLVGHLADDGSGWVPVAGVRERRGLFGEEWALGPLEAFGAEVGLPGGLDAVVHMAARAHVLDEPEADPLEAFRRVNLDGALRLARQAADSGVRRFLFVSSVGVNGNASQRPFTERDVPAPQEPYAVSKYEAEQALWDLAAATGMEVVVVRPPLVYGPGAPGNFGSLLRWVNKGVPLPLGAVTQNRRSLVALDNLVDLIVTCLEHPAAAGETFLVADGEDVSTAGLLRKVGDALERPARLVPVPVWMLRAGAMALGKREMARRLLGSLQVDASKAREVLGWVPPVSLDEGLRRAVAPLRR
ncbi:nucleoside-diphosphate sugar epimerase [Thioalkalivibrio versutus]|uniref:Nucleoside-diphosphate sugar epimerase n=1 Tax=Thioalkalivibrio versutus TaxID=106634 RepID=A0A0G3G5M4_9GAMM|nr:SDR family oxidoreductase [Thioalkalivibrio versutus]AKJ94797.1 nucleoside-diphosphate sugar epimerase [Thioalkalivibrio versutus]